MSKLGVSDPTSAGAVVCCFDASAVNNTDFNNLTSASFYDPSTGSQLTDGLKFAYLGVASASKFHLAFRSMNPADTATNTDGVITSFGGFDLDTQAIAAGLNITTVSYKKTVASDDLLVYAGFNY
jgi:hypothetical protein